MSTRIGWYFVAALWSVLMFALIISTMGCGMIRTSIVAPALKENMAWVRMIQSTAKTYEAKERSDCVAGFVKGLHITSQGGPGVTMVVNEMDMRADKAGTPYNNCYDLSLLILYQMEEARYQFDRLMPSITDLIASVLAVP